MDTPAITIHGGEVPVSLRLQYAVREEIWGEYVRATEEGQHRRVISAAVLLCCPSLLKESRLDYKAAGFSVMAFGGAAYGWLREKKGATIEELVRAAEVLFPALQATLIPWQEVKDRADFSDAPAGG